MSEAAQQLASALSDQPANPLRNHQVEEYRGEQSRLQSVVNAPPYVTGVDRGGAAKQYRQVSKLLDEQAAKPLSGAKRDQVAKLAGEVLGEIKEAMLPREEMRRNPAGAVGKFLRTENSPEVQQKIQNWKRAQLALEQGNPDPDLANVERFRPEMHTPGQAATFMAGAQIPGQFAMTAQAKENWPLGEPLVDTPLKQVQRREQTQAQKDGLAKARAARAAKKEQAV